MKHWILSAFMGLGLAAQGQVQFTSFKEVMDYADAHAIAIQSALISEQIAKSEKKEARSYLLPELSSSLGYNDNITLQPTLIPAQAFNPEAPEGTYQELTFGTKYVYNAGLQVQWDVLNFQKIFAAQTAGLYEQESQLHTALSRFQTYNQLASTYYSILLTEEALKIYRENLQTATFLFESAEEKYRQGMISEPDRNQAEINKLQRQRVLQLTENNLNQLYVQLQSQLNTKEPLLIEDDPSQFLLEDLSIRSQHPELLLEEAKLDTYASLLKKEKALRYPSLSLFYQQYQNWATDDFFGFSNSETLPQQTFGVKISMSGLLSPSTSQKIKQSEWQVELQQQQVEYIQLEKQKEDELLQLLFDQAFGQLAENKEILALQKSNDKHAENKYQAGLISLERRLDQYDDLLAAQDNYLQSLADYTLSQYKIYIRQIEFQPEDIN